MQVTAPKPVERADRMSNAPETAPQPIHSEQNAVEDPFKLLQTIPAEEDCPSFYLGPESEIHVQSNVLIESISRTQSAIENTESIIASLTSIANLLGGPLRSTAGMSPDKAQELRKKMAEYVDQISSKTRDLQLFSHFMSSDGTLVESQATLQFKSYLDDGMDFLQQAEIVNTKKQLKNFDENMRKKLDEIREFKKLLAQRVQDRAEKAKHLHETHEDLSAKRERSTPLDAVKATAKAILNALADPSLLHKELSRKRSAHLLQYGITETSRQDLQVTQWS